MINLSDIQAAREAAREVVRHTPVFPVKSLSEIAGQTIWLKMENFQRTGSFKIRGAYECLRRMPEEKRRKGVVTGSAGNHAQGLALAARMLGIPATIFMPSTGSIAKMQATKGYGAGVRLEGTSFAEASEAARSFASETGAAFVPAFDNDLVICGQGTCGLEILDDVPQVRHVLIPVGGGGLFGGVASAIKLQRPEVELIGVQSEAVDTAARSWAAGRLLTDLPTRYTIADGIAVKSPSNRTFEYMQHYADRMITVDDRSISGAVLWLLERKKVVVEGAGAVGVAAIRSGKVSLQGDAVVLISGGNIDSKAIADLVEREMLINSRYYQFFTAVPDRPGGLVALLTLVAQAQGNIMTVNHNRIHRGVLLGWTGVELLVEVRDAEHIARLEAVLEEHGYQVTQLS